MSFIRGTDPLALLALQAGQTPTPAERAGAGGSNPLDVQQRSHAIGDPVPIVFGRRRDGAGGVFISPAATECRFENDTDNDVTAYYHLVLSEGRIGALQVRDVFQRQCRVGSFKQTYNRRAGNWQPENAIVLRSGFDKPEATYLCGSVGAYPGISTMSFVVTVPNGLDVWNRQVHCFVRSGMEVYRWADEQADEPSDSFADLAYWLMQRFARIPLELIDTDSIADASVFLEANNITTNCWITEAINYSELISRWGRYHLLRSSNRNGKVGLKPLLPVNEDGTIKTTSLAIDYLFDDDLIIPGSEQIVYSDWASRQPFVCQVIWRQQLDADVGIIRTAEVRFAGTAPNGPYESHDLSEFCTREDHAVKVGAYILSKRLRSNHTIRFKVRPEQHSTTVEQGSVVRVKLQRKANNAPAGSHDYLYEVERITRTLAGDIQYECSHLPVDDQLRSLTALDVANATGSGVLLESNLTGLGCDLNSSTDTSSPADDEFLLADFEFETVELAFDPSLLATVPEVDFLDQAEFNAFVEDLTPAELVEFAGDELAGLTEQLGEDTTGLSDLQIAEQFETELKDLMSSSAALKEKFEEEKVPVTDERGEHLAGIYFHAVTWDANELQIQMRLAPTGKAPRQDLGALNVSIASTSVVALLPNGRPVSPQPTSLPSVSFSGLIANPWNAETEGLPVPPADRVFQGQFNIPFDASAFPPVAEDPAQQLTYRAVVAFSTWSGGFTDVAFLNTATVDFVPTEVVNPPEPVETLLLLRMNGSNNSTTFTDSGPNALTVTRHGDAKISTAESKFDGASGYFDGDGDYLSINDASLALGEGDFTIEAWVKPVLPSPHRVYQGICFFEGPSGAQTGLYIENVGGLVSSYYLDWWNYTNPSADPSFESSDTIAFSGDATVWTHIAVVRQSGVLSLYVGGVKQPGTYSIGFAISATVVNIGTCVEFDEPYKGYIDELRISSGAVYTDSFTPPTAPFD